MSWSLIVHFGFPAKEGFVLRTGAAFAAMAACEARSEAAWAAACQALVGGGGLGGFGCLGGTIGKWLGRLGRRPEQMGASKLVLVQVCWLQGSQTCAGAGTVAPTVCRTFWIILDAFNTFRWLTKEVFFS